MASINLTSGAIAKISQGLGDKLQPVLQVVEIRLVNTQQSSAERYRMLLSDGVHHQQGMLATQMNGIVKSGQLQKGSIVQLSEFICNTIQSRRIIIIISLQVLVEKAEIIGEPKNYDSGNPVLQNRVAGLGQPPEVNQPGLSIENAQHHGGSRASGPDVGQHALGDASFPRQESAVNNQSHVGSFAGDSVPGRNIRNANFLPSNAESATAGFMESNQIGGMQQKRFPGSSNGGFQPPANSYGRPIQSTYQQPAPIYTNRGPIAKNEAPARIIPIAALNPYQGKWTIKARVTAKADIRHYNNARGEGKVFSFDLLDSDGGEIRATCFNMVADQFYDQIEVGRIYLISKGTLRPTQKSFNHLNNEYEIMLESTSTIQPCLEEDNSIPRQQFSFKPISEIESMENNTMADLIGIVTSINPAGTIMRKNGTETHKRTLQLKDMSGKSVEITLWGNFCNTEGQKIQGMCDSGVFPVLAIKTGRVSDFSGKSIGTISSSQVLIDPDIPETHQLKEWYNSEGKNHTALSISREAAIMGRMDVRKTVSQIKDEGLGRSEKPDWITVKATVSFLKADNFCYTACPLMVSDRQCNKKVNNNGDGTWHCDRCDKSFSECDYRYLLQLQIQDHTGITWVTAFQECGEEILGVSAKELYFLKYEEQDELKFAEVIRRVLFSQYLFKLKVKEETFSDEQRVKSTAIKAERVNPSSESRFILGMIERLSVEDAHAVSAIHGAYASGAGVHNSEYSHSEVNHSRQSVNNLPLGGGGGGGGFDRYMNQYGGISSHSMNREVPSFCNNCGLSGHSFQNCPRSLSELGQSTGGGFTHRSSISGMEGGNSSNVCFKCKQPGHWARDCPGSSSISVGFGGRDIASSVGSGHPQGTYGKQYVGGF
ncbi:hypothetical protein KFK09_003281 [Dendrobium nobile]|uniref:Replication protein A subunit n=1 Tax=Dendrobium nobile TaxID=94219 RepID=A0A8T3C9P9_DENNO|nr:hypothetical protein KFK09_003281 [Dendrobium nobile]